MSTSDPSSSSSKIPAKSATAIVVSLAAAIGVAIVCAGWLGSNPVDQKTLSDPEHPTSADVSGRLMKSASTLGDPPALSLRSLASTPETSTTAEARHAAVQANAPAASELPTNGDWYETEGIADPCLAGTAASLRDNDESFAFAMKQLWKENGLPGSPSAEDLAQLRRFVQPDLEVLVEIEKDLDRQHERWVRPDGPSLVEFRNVDEAKVYLQQLHGLPNGKLSRIATISVKPNPHGPASCWPNVADPAEYPELYRATRELLLTQQQTAARLLEHARQLASRR